MSYYNNDPYDNGIPKYTSAQDIYDGLCELAQNEEAGILGEMFSDVSYDGQEYYYTDKGYDLKEKFEELSDYGNKMWVMDLAVWQIDDRNIHDLVYDALCDADMAKRLEFKTLFIEHMLRGDKSEYDEIADEYLAEVQELNRFDYWPMNTAFLSVMSARGQNLIVSPYRDFCNALYKKASNLRLEKETLLIVECRALLNSYDDFILGLRMNQTLHNELQQMYLSKVAALEASYEKR